MKLLAVSVGQPREIDTDAGVVRTSIFKTPVTERVWVGPTNITGDAQSDLTVHGGPNKAVYVYPSEHYASWQRDLAARDLPWGSFGENFTTLGLVEHDVCIGDQFLVGSAEFVVTQPRTPCFKLALRFGRDDMVERFVASTRSGFYLAVDREGEVQAGDRIERIGQDDRRLTVADVYRLRLGRGTRATLQIAASHPGLTDSWREHFQQRLREGKA